MNILGLNIKRIKDKEELKSILLSFNQKEEDIKNISDGNNFLLNNNFLAGYKNINKDCILVYMVRDETNKDNIYIRKKLKLFKAFIDRQTNIKHKKVISGVRADKEVAIKLNICLFKYMTDPIKLEDDNEYIYFRNYK